MIKKVKRKMKLKIYCVNCQGLIARMSAPKNGKESMLTCPHCNMVFGVVFAYKDGAMESSGLILPIESSFPYCDMDKNLLPKFHCPVCKAFLSPHDFGESLKCEECNRVFAWNH